MKDRLSFMPSKEGVVCSSLFVASFPANKHSPVEKSGYVVLDCLLKLRMLRSKHRPSLMIH
jgi:hypothetical protein